jgi:hypothetical protein
MCSITTISSIILNVLVVRTLKKRNSLRIPFGRFFLQLTIVDFTACVAILIPTCVVAIMSSWKLTTYACYAQGVIANFLYLNSFTIISLMTIERRVKLTNEGFYKTLFDPKWKVVVLSIFVWIINLGISAIPISNWIETSYDFYHAACTVRFDEALYYLVGVFSVGLALAFCVGLCTFPCIFHKRMNEIKRKKEADALNEKNDNIKSNIDNYDGSIMKMNSNDVNKQNGSEVPEGNRGINIIEMSRHQPRHSISRSRSRLQTARRRLEYVAETSRTVFVNDNSVDFNLAVTVFITWCVMVICWLPYFIVAFYDSFHASCWSGFYTIALIVALPTYCLRPLIYLAYNRHDQSTTEHDSENISRSTKVKSFKKAINKLDKVVFMSTKKRKIDVEKGTKAGQDETKSDEKFGKNKKSHNHNKVVFSKHAKSVKDNHSEQSAERKQHRSNGYESDNDTRRRNSNSNSKLIAVGIISTEHTTNESNYPYQTRNTHEFQDKITKKTQTKNTRKADDINTERIYVRSKSKHTEETQGSNEDRRAPNEDTFNSEQIREGKNKRLQDPDVKHTHVKANLHSTRSKVNLDDNNTSNFDDDDHINSYYNHEFKYEEREVIEGSKRSKDATRHDPSDKHTKDIARHDPSDKRTKDVARHDPSDKRSKDVARHDPSDKRTKDVARHDPSDKHTKDVARHDPSDKRTKDVARHDPSGKRTKDVARHDPSDKLSKDVAHHDPSDKRSKDVARPDPSDKRSKDVAYHETSDKRTKDVEHHDTSGSFKHQDRRAKDPYYDTNRDITVSYINEPDKSSDGVQNHGSSKNARQNDIDLEKRSNDSNNRDQTVYGIDSRDKYSNDVKNREQSVSYINEPGKPTNHAKKHDRSSGISNNDEQNVRVRNKHSNNNIKNSDPDISKNERKNVSDLSNGIEKSKQAVPSINDHDKRSNEVRNRDQAIPGRHDHDKRSNEARNHDQSISGINDQNKRSNEVMNLKPTVSSINNDDTSPNDVRKRDQSISSINEDYKRSSDNRIRNQSVPSINDQNKRSSEARNRKPAVSSINDDDKSPNNARKHDQPISRIHDDDKRSSDPRIRDEAGVNNANNNQIRNRKEKQNHIEDVPTYEGSKRDAKKDNNPIKETQDPIKNGSNPRYQERKPNVQDTSRLPSSDPGGNKSTSVSIPEVEGITARNEKTNSNFARKTSVDAKLAVGTSDATNYENVNLPKKNPEMLQNTKNIDLGNPPVLSAGRNVQSNGKSAFNESPDSHVDLKPLQASYGIAQSNVQNMPDVSAAGTKISHHWPNALPVYTTTFRGKNANTNRNVNSVPTESGYNERERRSTENPSMFDVTRSSNIYNSVHGDNNYLF